MSDRMYCLICGASMVPLESGTLKTKVMEEHLKENHKPGAMRLYLARLAAFPTPEAKQIRELQARLNALAVSAIRMSADSGPEMLTQCGDCGLWVADMEAHGLTCEENLVSDDPPPLPNAVLSARLGRQPAPAYTQLANTLTTYIRAALQIDGPLPVGLAYDLVTALNTCIATAAAGNPANSPALQTAAVKGQRHPDPADHID